MVGFRKPVASITPIDQLVSALIIFEKVNHTIFKVICIDDESNKWFVLIIAYHGYDIFFIAKNCLMQNWISIFYTYNLLRTPVM